MLDIFTFTADRYPRVINAIDGTQTNNHYHMDVLTALFPLLWKPRVGPYAKEALLIAINMHDRRIDNFILQHTNLPHILVQDICKRYMLLFDSLTNNNLQLSIALATSTPSNKQRQGLAETATMSSKGNKLAAHSALQSPSSSTTNSPIKQPATIDTNDSKELMNDPMEQFCSTIRFFDALVSAASNDSLTIISNDVNNTTTTSTTNGSLQSVLLDIYNNIFLQGVLNRSFANNPSEQQTLATTIIVRNLLTQLSTTTNPLRQLTSHCLSTNGVNGINDER
jgi:hypothetical protein